MAITAFLTDSTLCIGCKACEVACKEWNGVGEDGLNWSGYSYDNTGAVRPLHLAPRKVRRVRSRARIRGQCTGAELLVLLLRCLQALRKRGMPGSLSDGSAGAH